MLTFGHTTSNDVLSWIIVLTLGIKVGATAILLIVGKDMRDRPGWGAWLWWATKITPVIAVPCLIWLAWIQRVTDHMWALMAMMLFVVIAVPIKVRQRRNRIAGRVSANPLA